MIIIPAIDLKDGKCVRLFQGKFDNVKEYSSDPVAVAKKWEAAGAKLIHVVDLDGALTGELKNIESVRAIVENVSARIEFGGGLRDEAAIQKMLDLGVDRVVLGTKALEDFTFLKKCVAKHREKIVVGIDSKDGIVYSKGWTEKGDKSALNLARNVEFIGVRNIICTDIARDGALTRPNIEFYKQLKKTVKINIIGSGGVSSLKDLVDLMAIGLYGVIAGKALYEERIDLKEAIRLCSQKE